MLKMLLQQIFQSQEIWEVMLKLRGLDTLKRSSKKRKKKIKAKSTWKEKLCQMKSLMFKRKKRTSKKVLMTKNDLKLLGRSSDLRKISRAKKKRATWFKNDWAWVFIKNWNLYINIGKALKHWRWNKFQKAFALEFFITCFILP